MVAHCTQDSHIGTDRDRQVPPRYAPRDLLRGMATLVRYTSMCRFISLNHARLCLWSQVDFHPGTGLAYSQQIQGIGCTSGRQFNLASLLTR
jgi:hypothetical protein